MNIVYKYHCIHFLQRTFPPFFCNRQYLICNTAYCTVRYIKSVYLLNMSCDVVFGHFFCIHRDNFFFNIIRQRCLMFLNELRIKSTAAVTGNGNIHVAKADFHGLFTVTVAAVVCFLIAVIVL